MGIAILFSLSMIAHFGLGQVYNNLSHSCTCSNSHVQTSTIVRSNSTVIGHTTTYTASAHSTTTATNSNPITIGPPYQPSGTYSNTSCSTTIVSTCIPSAVELQSTLNLNSSCNPCSVTLQNALTLAPPIVCYQEYTQTIEVLILNGSSTTITSTDDVYPDTGTQTITLSNVNAPETPAVALAITARRDSTPCFTVTSTISAAAPTLGQRYEGLWLADCG